MYYSLRMRRLNIDDLLPLTSCWSDLGIRDEISSSFVVPAIRGIFSHIPINRHLFAYTAKLFISLDVSKCSIPREIIAADPPP